MMLTPFNYADKVVEGVETFFSMQRQTLQMAFENLESQEFFDMRVLAGHIPPKCN